MPIIHKNVSLKSLNTFGIDVNARFFCEISSEHDLLELIKDPIYQENHVLILGGGSNILFTGDFNGLVIKSHILGKEVISTDDHFILLKAGSGEVWHDLVMHAVRNNWGGIENLSLIPGTSGAAPMQNIGA